MLSAKIGLLTVFSLANPGNAPAGADRMPATYAESDIFANPLFFRHRLGDLTQLKASWLALDQLALRPYGMSRSREKNGMRRPSQSRSELFWGVEAERENQGRERRLLVLVRLGVLGVLVVRFLETQTPWVGCRTMPLVVLHCSVQISVGLLIWIKG